MGTIFGRPAPVVGKSQIESQPQILNLWTSNPKSEKANPKSQITNTQIKSNLQRTPQLGQRSPKKFKSQALKIWPKIHRMRVNNFGSSGSILNLFFIRRAVSLWL